MSEPTPPAGDGGSQNPFAGFDPKSINAESIKKAPPQVLMIRKDETPAVAAPETVLAPAAAPRHGAPAPLRPPPGGLEPALQFHSSTLPPRLPRDQNAAEPRT